MDQENQIIDPSIVALAQEIVTGAGIVSVK
jgi:hypothetical protein